jgi:hypothetical protein
MIDDARTRQLAEIWKQSSLDDLVADLATLTHMIRLRAYAAAAGVLTDDEVDRFLAAERADPERTARIRRIFEAKDQALYDAAREACHASGLPWTDPRTGLTYYPLPTRLPRVTP